MTLVYPAHDFDAFLTAVLETWVNRASDQAIWADQGDWFGPEGPCRAVTADPDAARRVTEGVSRLAGPLAARYLGDAFRHRDPGKEAVLTEFVRLCVRHRRATLGGLEPAVRETVRRAEAVRSEAHRFLGLTRFTQVSGGWYARIEPDHDVVGMLTLALGRRMGGDDWMLHDAGRGLAWVCQAGEGRFVRGVELVASVTESESAAQALWQRYFATIALPNRIRPDLQRSKMPQKTWKNLVEVPGHLRPR